MGKIDVKTIKGNKIYYNKAFDVISNSPVDETAFSNESLYVRTVPDGVYDICIEITTKCNQRCRNCFAFSTPETGKELDYDYISNIISKASKDRIRIGITGGEPFLHSRIRDILALGSKFQDINFMISSNGNFELTSEIAQLLVDGDWLLSLSLHGRKTSHNMYTESQGFDNVIKKIQTLNDKIVIHIYSVINKFMTKEDVDYLLELQNQYRIFYTRFIIPRNVGRVDFNYDTSLITYINEKVIGMSKAGMKKDYSHTEMINVDGIGRIMDK